jgi:hypothetical protein
MKKAFFLPMFLMVILFSNVAFADLVWVPAQIANAKKGDVMLQGNPYNFIGKLLAMFGGYWSHSGMMASDYTSIRHNTMDINLMRQNKNWLGIPTSLNAYDLENGPPGTITESVDTAYQGTAEWGMNTATDAVLSLADADEAALRPTVNAIADKYLWLDMFYRINSYVNSSVDNWLSKFNNSNARVAGKGGHCSGSIWYSNYLSGKQMLVYHAPTSLIDAGSLSLYDSVKQMVNDQINAQAGIFAFVAAGTDDKIANQVVNGFGFNIYDDTTNSWRSKLGTVETYADAPDHLLLNVMSNPSGNKAGVQTETSTYYKKLAPIQVTGGYWMETGTSTVTTAVLYVDASYSGAQKKLNGVGQWSIAGDFNDRVTAVKVAANYVLTLYENSDYTGQSYQYTGWVSNIGSTFNDKASAAKIDRENNQAKVVVYVDQNYAGVSKSYYASVNDSTLGSDINDKITSIFISPGWKVTVYINTKFGGSAMTYTSSVANVGSTFNDKISSIKVSKI